MRIDASLLNYIPEQLAEWDKRSQEIGYKTALYCSSLYAEKPTYWNAHQEEFQLKAATHLMELARASLTPEEILAQFTVQRSQIIIEMMNMAAKGKKGAKQ